MMSFTLIRGGGDQLPPGTVRPAKQAAAVANVRTRPRPPAHPVPLYDHETEPAPETVFLPLTPLEWSLIHQALAERGQGNTLRVGSQAHADLAAKVHRMVRSRISHPSTQPDDTPPFGTPRPGA